MIYTRTCTCGHPYHATVHCYNHITHRWITVKSHERHGVSHHRQLDCLFNSFWCLQQIKHQSSTLAILCEWNPLVTDGWPWQSASNAETVSMRWRPRGHLVLFHITHRDPNIKYSYAHFPVSLIFSNRDSVNQQWLPTWIISCCGIWILIPDIISLEPFVCKDAPEVRAIFW